ncbi:NAD(P)-binding protein [Stipitochalara longipes BDJ]|nr:NAD(P)-binding protein [Stipitochalara longipes BDJ]
MPHLQKKTALITGCSTGGIGWAMAKAESLTELSDVEILEVDVTDPEIISQCKETVAQRTSGKLNVLINNAGAEFVCPLLDTGIAEAKKLDDINVWGPLAMAQVSIASGLPICGRVSAYASAKAAEARMSEVIRLEPKPLGVRVLTAVLGSYYEVQEHAYKQRMAHQGESMKVEPFAKELVKDILSGNRGPWYVDKLSNADPGVELVKRL